MTATPSLKDTISTGSSGSNKTYGANWDAAYFTAGSSYLLNYVAIQSVRHGATGNITVSIKATDANHKPTGADLAVGSADTSGWSTSWATNSVYMDTPYQIVQGTEYAIVARLPSGTSSVYIQIGDDGTHNDSWASTDSGSTWSAAKRRSFKTYGCSPPVVLTANAISITHNSASLQGTVEYPGDFTQLYLKFEWGLTAAYGNETSEQSVSNVPQAFSATITGLTPSTTYHFKAEARYE